MGDVTAWVRKALADLGQGASDKDVKAYIAREAPTVPQGHISLALRRLRGGASALRDGGRNRPIRLSRKI